MAFRGTFDHTLDAKNRLTVPARVAAPVGGSGPRAARRPQAVRGCGADDDEYIDDPREFPPLSSAADGARALLLLQLPRAELDAAGRIMVPSSSATRS